MHTNVVLDGLRPMDHHRSKETLRDPGVKNCLLKISREERHSVYINRGRGNKQQGDRFTYIGVLS